MDAQTRRELLELLGEGDCCCCCEDRPRDSPLAARVGGDLAPLGRLPERPGTDLRTGQPDMPALKLRPVFDEAFISPVQSFDSPQRPGFWGGLTVVPNG